jgi:hypothetical protein
VPGAFKLVYLVANTIMNVTTQDDQLAVFVNAAAHLEPGGCFVVEVIVPQLRRVPPGEVARVFTPFGGRCGGQHARSGHAGQAGRLRREARVLMSALDEAKGR